MKHILNRAQRLWRNLWRNQKKAEPEDGYLPVPPKSKVYARTMYRTRGRGRPKPYPLGEEE